MSIMQFHDMIMVASVAPRAANAMCDVCATLSDIWNLRVLCL